MATDGDAARVNTGMRLLPATVAALDEAAARLGKSRAFVVEVLTALHAASLTPETAIPLGLLPPDSRARRSPKPGPPGQPARRRPS